jgi:hypothetical protein
MTRPVGGFTKGQEAFLEAYIKHNDREKAEKEAGLAPRSGYAVLSNPAVMAEYQRRLRSELMDLGSLAIAKVKHNLTSDKVPAAVGQKAAEFVLNELKAGTEGSAAKELHELTSDELNAMIAHLDARKASLALPINTPEVFD